MMITGRMSSTKSEMLIPAANRVNSWLVGAIHLEEVRGELKAN
jgi:hypothetical protein